VQLNVQLGEVVVVSGVSVGAGNVDRMDGVVGVIGGGAGVGWCVQPTSRIANAANTIRLPARMPHHVLLFARTRTDTIIRCRLQRLSAVMRDRDGVRCTGQRIAM
jgi:hypothetical protein